MDHKLADISQSIAAQFHLTEEDIRALLPSGKDRVFGNRLGWARTYLKKAGLVSYSTWGVFRITDEGNAALTEIGNGKIDLSFLKKYPSFLEFYSPTPASQDAKVNPVLAVEPKAEEKQLDPEEAVEISTLLLRDRLKAELLSKVKTVPPGAFEDLVVRLIKKMGYGSTLVDAGQAVGGSGDGGIDGIINEDRLGIDRIYLQAKRWEGSVGRPIVQGFAGALQGRNSSRGVLITTSFFTKDAEEYVKHLPARIILIDGSKLVDLMFEHNVGVVNKRTHEIKSLDLTFFEELEG